MKQQKWGRVIHIGSVWGFAGGPARSAYSATKFALRGLTCVAAVELGPHNITVNCIAPGPFLTELLQSTRSEEVSLAASIRCTPVLTVLLPMCQDLRQAAVAVPLGRIADCKELMGPALMLASEAGSFTTGQTLVVDGGLLAGSRAGL